MYSRKLISTLLGAAALFAMTAAVSAKDVIKIGELNSYKTQPAFLGPYNKSMDLAVEQNNAAVGVNGKSP
jgi:branched-chain amino acid transport system substrate-binding protein